MMVKCPECGEEIEWLLWIHEIVSAVGLDVDDETPSVERLGEYDEDEEADLMCPLCEKVVAKSLFKAKKFLKGEVVSRS